MYKVIGSDGKEYGPVTAEQLRQWVAEGRANAQTRVQAEGSAEWKPLSVFPELCDEPVATVTGVVEPSGGRQHEPAGLDIGECIVRSWNLLKNHFWLIVGATFLIGFIVGFVGLALRIVVNFASGVTFHALARARGLEGLRLQLPGIAVSTLWYWVMTGPMIGGLYSLYLKLIRGQTASIADAFAGFGPQFGQLVIGGFLVSLLTVLGLFLCLIPGIYLSVGWRFALLSIIDKHLGFWEGMEMSRKTVTSHWWMVFALCLLTGLIAAAGVLACCVGLLVTAPIMIGAIAYAYEDLIGVRNTAAS